MHLLYTLVLITGYQHLTAASPARLYPRDLQRSHIRLHRASRQVAQSACDARLIATGSSSGEISSPNFPHPYLAANCTWTISAPKDQTLEVEFTSVDIGCRHGDHLRVNDGNNLNSNIILYICGRGTPNPIASSGQHLFIWFYARANSDTKNGFHIKFKAVGQPNEGVLDACKNPGLQLSQPVGVITSDGFSDQGTGGYGNDLDCRWRIQVQEYFVVLLQFESFLLEDSTDCRYDHITIHDGPSTANEQLAKLCGSMSPVTIKSTNRYIYIHFQTDKSVTANGFRLIWESLPLSLRNDGSSAGCGQYPTLLSGTSGVLSSPYFGGEAKYPPLSRCMYHITGLPGKAINLKISNLSLEEGFNCAFDWLKVYDGPSDTNTLLAGPICGSNLVTVPPSSSYQVLVEFVSDLSREYGGFQLEWSQIVNDDPCAGGGVTLTAPAGTIASPGYGGTSYNNNQNCKWRIQVPDNSQVTLTWQSMDLEAQPACGYDNVKLYDGSDASSKFLGSYCGVELPPTVKSTGNSMLIQFESDYSVIKEGFILQYEVGDPGTRNDGSHAGCAGTPARLAGTQGTFSTPTVGKEYPSNSNCAWRITAPPGKVILLTFTEIDLEYDTRCAWDQLKVYQGSDLNGAELRTVCGREHDFTVRGQELYVQFTSDATVQRTGFIGLWREESSQGEGEIPTNGLSLTDSCGKTYTPVKDESETQWRIIGGREARKHSLPWQVTLIQDEFFRCGASILSERWILTATHCVENIRASRLTVIAGNHALFRVEESEQNIPVRQKFEHPAYNTPTYDKDVTLLELNSSLIFNEYVQPICLPSSDLPTGTKCIASGWGDTRYPRGSVASHLQQVYVPLIHQAECSAKYNGTLTDNMLCAGNIHRGGIDPCFGDSGGPLACLHNDHWQLQGVISWGSGCAERGNPGVYTRVTRFLHWIQAITGGRGNH